jgi:ATP-binding cassette subfamily F protein 3
MITLKDVSLRRGTKLVLDAANVTLQPGENVGLVGRNGAGKSSLFALLTNRLQSDGGDFYMPPRWRVAAPGSGRAPGSGEPVSQP